MPYDKEPPQACTRVLVRASMGEILSDMNKIPAKLLSELNRQLNQEFSAAHSYRALSLWCDDQNFKGFAHYFAKQSTEELNHGHKITAHLINRGVLPELGAIPAPQHAFKSLLEAAQHAQALELEN